MLSYSFDHSVQNIWIQSKDSVFSHGVDYKKLTEDKSYLDKLFKFAILFASINKPVFSQVSGGAKGVGAYLLSMITMPLGYTNTYMKIDDTMRGLTPLMGGTHRLSRLPLHLGYYLALTGDEFNFEEMTQIGYIKGTICNDVKNREIRSKLQEANLYFRQKPKYTDYDEQKLQQQQKQLVKKNKQKYEKHLKYRQGEIIAQSTSNLNLKFAVNQHLAASSDYYNTLNPFNSFYKQRNVNNYYKMRLERPLEYLKQHKLVEVFEVDGIQIPRLDLAKIDYIFSQDSLEKIINSLKEEKSEWAQSAYRKITNSDPLALHLTFELLRKAEKLPWIACLENEFAVARRLIEKSELRLKTYKNSSQFALINEYSNKSILQVPKQAIEYYLSPAEGQYRLEHNVKSHSLHPYNDYYQTVPDSVRKYINQQQLNDSMLNQQPPQVMRFLNNNKINYSSQVFDLAILRKYLYNQLQLQKEKESIIKRLNFISRNDHFLAKYKSERQAYLDSISQQDLQAKIDQSIKHIFNSKFEQRFKDFQEKTANMIGLQNKLSLFKNIKSIILNNLLYNGAAYEQYQSQNTSYNGPIYFDPKGKDIYSSTNPNITSNARLNQLTNDLSKGLQLSETFLKHQHQQMPTYIATPQLPLQQRQKDERSVWELIKFRYDEKPQVWAEAYVYKEMVEKAARTSEELSGYLQWTFQNYYDLLNYSDKKNETYGEFAADMVSQIKNNRQIKIQKLKALEQQRKIVNQKNIFSKIYQYKDEQKMRQCFPYYVNETVIPGQFRKAFLAVLDSTLKQFTEMDKIGQKKLLLKQELGVVDHWINKDITTNYTELLKNDVQYVTSYLQILMVKEMITTLQQHKYNKKTTEESLEYIRENYNVDFYFSSSKVTPKDVNAKIFSFLYFLMDMHTKAKKNLKSPQSKLIDFINRLKQSHEQCHLSSMPYSFEGLMLMIAKDRRRIYDRYIGQQFISEPEFFIEHITRESKKTGQDLYRRKDLEGELAKRTFKEYVGKHIDAFKQQRKSLIQNYFYYMMLFEKHIHQICGKDHFIPTGFINEQHIKYNNYCQQLFRPKSLEDWLKDELNIVIEQLLDERFEVEKKLSKGQLYLYDQSFNERFKVASIKLLIQKKIEEEIYLLKNIFGQSREYDFQATEEEKSDFEYTRAKRMIKNTSGLKKLNNLALSQQISLEYMSKANQTQHMTPAEKNFAKNEKQYLKNGMASRLPSKSYQRMARDLYAYPEEVYPAQAPQDIESFKKTHISFSKTASEKIVLSNFTPEYKALSAKIKDDILNEMVSKIKAVQSL